MFLTWVRRMPTACCSLLRASSSTVPSQYCATSFVVLVIFYMLYGGERLRRPILHVKPYGRTKWISRGDPPAAARSSRSRRALCLSLEREQEKRKRCRVGRAPPQWHAAPPPAPARQGGCRRGARAIEREGGRAPQSGGRVGAAGTPREADSRLRRRIPQPPATES